MEVSRESKGPPSADLLVCFPSRAHLTLMMPKPKPICSPARPCEPSKRRRHHHHHQKPINRPITGQASPLPWAKPKPTGREIAEPTSPRVTCSGQIKIRPNSKSSPSRNWQSVMEEIERLHNNKIKHKERANWVESLRFKREIVQFLTCLRNIKFDFRCFGSFPATGLNSDEENYEKGQVGIDGCDGNGSPKTIFSKWFMVLQEGQNSKFTREQSLNIGKSHNKEEHVAEEIRPPPNALLLMRCRSAPAKRWVEERENAKDEEREEEEKEEKTELVMEEEEGNNNSLAMVMRNDTDFHKFSCEIAKKTWAWGGVRELLFRSQSWKR
ncbi:Whirlin like [Actinidia chinensis var. chinensis]|uniref:Whirlin like n=1 Tax=Actinidia chinensis var. chinensis TaxID=1590841 RepID=A0A2R6R2U0_ACTCC|nr:Whirlin like [Actinidia chinensis var. chinensis]